MLRKLDPWTTALTAVLLVGALLACKKKETDTTAPTASVASAPAPVALVTPPPNATAAAPTVGAKLGDVKRYADKEKAQTGAARVIEDGVKVYDEADDKTAEVATLDKGLLVFRLASIPDWELVEFPSGVGKVSPGWVLAKSVDTNSVASVKRDAVATQAKTAVVKTVSSAAPNSSAVASVTKPAPSATAPSAAEIASAKAAEKVAAAASAKAIADKAAADAAAALAKAQKAADRAAAKVKASSKP